MSKNKKANLSKIIISMENDKINYRDTGKSLVIPYEGDDMNRTKPPKYFTDFATEVRSFMEQQLEFNKAQLEFNRAIMECPTIKKELSNIKNKNA